MQNILQLALLQFLQQEGDVLLQHNGFHDAWHVLQDFQQFT